MIGYAKYFESNMSDFLYFFLWYFTFICLINNVSVLGLILVMLVSLLFNNQ